MDCDDVILLLASSTQHTLTGREDARLHAHLGECATCRSAATEIREEGTWRWLTRIPVDALEGEEIDVLPTVDPVVFLTRGEVASGGMGKVTRVYDRRLGREIAVKELLDEDMRARFVREIRITARLQHPAIVSIYEAGAFPHGATFYSMRLVPGRTLQDAIADATTLDARLRLLPHVRAAIDAISFAHARGVVHRDLKPSNILVGEFGETVVIDWGLAKEIDRDDEPMPERVSTPALTRSGSVMGTPCFMSPQQAVGEDADASDDVYALGAILYNLLVGAPPYWDTTREVEALVTATRNGPPTSLDELAPEAPEDLRAIIARAMARTKADRFASAAELAAELARFEAGQLVRSRTYTTRELVTRWLREHRRAVALALIAAIAAIAIGITWLRYRAAAEELAIRERGAKLTDLYGEVARQAYRIDLDLLHMENALEGLATAAAWALTSPAPSDSEIYFDANFADTKHPPPGYTDQTAYRWPVSVEHPVVSVAPGVERTHLLPQIAKLTSLRHHIREMVLEAALGDPTKIPADVARATLLGRKGPIDYAYIDLPEGVHVVWPGMAGLRSTYDVRTASFYQMSKFKRGKRWGAPYIDSTTDRKGDDLVLPCTKGVWSPAGEFLGVAGVEITITKMVETSMRMPQRTTLRASLVDERGRKVIDSLDANKWFSSSGRDEAIEFVDFGLPDVAAEIRAKHEGVLLTARGGRSIVAAFVRLDVLGWYYVVEVDASSLGE